MSKATALVKGLAVSTALIGTALVISKCLNCQSTREASVTIVCAIVMIAALAVQVRYLFGTFLPSIWPTEEPAPERGERQQQFGQKTSELPLVNAVVNVSILVSIVIWAIGAILATYPPAIPLIFCAVGVASVLLFAAASRLSARVRTVIGRWQWMALSIGWGLFVVTAVVAYWFDTLRNYPFIGFLCGLLSLGMISCGMYRSGFSEDKWPGGGG